jgi:hypothetical protein
MLCSNDSARMLGRFSVAVFSLAFMAATNCGASNQSLKNIGAAKTVDDIFEKIAEIQLEARPECAIGYISDLAVDAEGRLIFADAIRSQGVYIFSPEGKFIQELGRRGQGPGEYRNPGSVEIGREGDIWVADPMVNRILIYDRKWQFVRAILGKAPNFTYFLHLGPKDEIFMFRSQANPRRPDASDTVLRFDSEGKMIASFAPCPEEAVKIDFTSMTDGLDIDKDGFLYEMNPLFYRIRKFAPDGKFITSFTRKTKLFKIVTQAGDSPTIVNGPFCLEKGLVIAQVSKHLEIYDTGGRFIVGEIPFCWRIIEANGNSLYAEVDDEENPEAGNPKILVYRLR